MFRLDFRSENRKCAKLEFRKVRELVGLGLLRGSQILDPSERNYKARYWGTLADLKVY